MLYCTKLAILHAFALDFIHPWTYHFNKQRNLKMFACRLQSRTKVHVAWLRHNNPFILPPLALTKSVVTLIGGWVAIDNPYILPPPFPLSSVVPM